MLQLVENLKKEISQDLIMSNKKFRNVTKSNQVQQPTAPQSFNIRYELMRPWADILFRTELPPYILDKMIKISDEILEDRNKIPWGKNLAGQIANEPLIPHEYLERDGLTGFFVNIVLEYLQCCLIQTATEGARAEMIKEKEKYSITLKSMWIIEQQPGEYNPAHVHTDCDVSAVMYLKVPEFLPSEKPERDDDGSIYFIGAALDGNTTLKKGVVKIKPRIGEFYIFPKHMLHTVYPYKTNDNFARRSISFNASFNYKNEEYTNSFAFASSRGEGEAIGPAATDKVILRGS